MWAIRTLFERREDVLIYHPCVNDVVRGIEVRTSLLGPVLALSKYSL
jgi:hypothetical protein